MTGLSQVKNYQLATAPHYIIYFFKYTIKANPSLYKETGSPLTCLMNPTRLCFGRPFQVAAAAFADIIFLTFSVMLRLRHSDVAPNGRSDVLRLCRKVKRRVPFHAQSALHARKGASRRQALHVPPNAEHIVEKAPSVVDKRRFFW